MKMQVVSGSSTAPFGFPARPRSANFGSTLRRSPQVAGLLALVALSGPVSAATAPSLGTASTYGIVSSTFTNTNTAPQSIINGTASQPAICYTTPPVTPPLTVVGTTVVPCPPVVNTDQGLALSNINGQACTSLGAGAITLDSIVIGANPPGTIPPGCYSSGGAMNITATTTVTLNGPGVYIFRPGGALSTGMNSRVILAGGACEADVFWAPVSAATIGANAALSATPTFVGNIIDDAGINIGHFANLTGRALAFNNTVTTDSVTISVPTCAPFVPGGGAVPTISKAFNPISISAGGISLLTITLNNPNAAVATLNAPFVDTLPNGVLVAPTPNVVSTCGVGVPVAIAGASTVSLPTGTTVPANGNCTLSMNVTAATGGIYVNTIPTGALVTSNGNNPAPAVATLTVALSSIPTLAPGVMLLLAALLALGGFAAMRRRLA